MYADALGPGLGPGAAQAQQLPLILAAGGAPPPAAPPLVKTMRSSTGDFYRETSSLGLQREPLGFKQSLPLRVAEKRPRARMQIIRVGGSGGWARTGARSVCA